MVKPQIRGLLDHPKKNARGGVYRGRFICPAVQWTGSGAEGFVTFTATADQLTDAADSQLVWTDQNVQRGIRPGISPPPASEIPVGAGYPDTKAYIFDSVNADDMVEKLLAGERLFLSPLVWNLRPGHFEAHWDAKAGDLYFYSGRIYLPDSHHRQQAIAKAVRTWREAPSSYPKFSGDQQFKVELYFLSREDEGNYFFDKNQRPKPTALSKAYDLTTLDDLSLLAKRTVAASKALADNVNRVTDRLTQKNPQVVTLSTLREMMKTLAPRDGLELTELEGLAAVAARFYDLLAVVRSELGPLPVAERRRVRSQLLVDSAVMMHGYAALMRAFNASLADQGTVEASQEWASKLQRLASTRSYRMRAWSGDIFDKRNPLWTVIGVTKPGRSQGSVTVLNTGAARGECGRVLRQLLAVEPVPDDLGFLADR